MTLSEALVLMASGKRIRRPGWDKELEAGFPKAAPESVRIIAAVYFYCGEAQTHFTLNRHEIEATDWETV